MIALLTLPFLLMIGGAVDLNFAYLRRADAQAAADSAVIAGLAHASKLMRENVDPADMATEVRQTVENYFAANTSYGQRLSNVQIDLVDDVSINLEFEDSGATKFLKMSGIDQLQTSGLSRGAVQTLTRADINFLVDGSASMGVAADPADFPRMYDMLGCGFACHSGSDTSYTDIRNAGIETRVDVARRAIIDTVDEFDLADSQTDVRFGLYLFSNWLVPLVEPSHTNSGNVTWLKQQINDNVSLVGPTGGGTNLRHTLTQLQAGIEMDQAIDNTRDRYLVIITDGIEDALEHYNAAGDYREDPNYQKFYPYWTGYWTWTQSIDARMCDDLKNIGITIAVVYTPYTVPTGYSGGETDQFEFIENELIYRSQDALRQCASHPDYYYVAEAPQLIVDAARDIGRKVSKSAHLLQ